MKARAQSGLVVFVAFFFCTVQDVALRARFALLGHLGELALLRFPEHFGELDFAVGGLHCDELLPRGFVRKPTHVVSKQCGTAVLAGAGNVV